MGCPLYSTVLLSNTLTFISGLCITIASQAKSFKEAQSTLTPVSLVICVPMFLELLDFKLGGYFTFIPILNHSFILNDIFAGNFDLLNIALFFSIFLVFARFIHFLLN